MDQRICLLSLFVTAFFSNIVFACKLVASYFLVCCMIVSGGMIRVSGGMIDA